MKKIINMKRYDTETAEKIGGWRNGTNYTDFRYCEESLYRTPKGTWFLHGEGGPFSKYGEVSASGREKYSGATILPLTEDEAAAWLSEHDVEAFEETFPQKALDA